MSPDARVTAAVVVGVVVAIATHRVSADLAMLGGLGLLLVAGVIGPADAFAGFANEGVLTVAFLYVVAAGLRDSGLVSRVAGWWLRPPRSDLDAQARVVGPIAALSTVVNNTPLVAVTLPMVASFARRHQIAPSRLYLPLSYAAILGGVCTLVGTSTNVVVQGLMLAHNRQPGVTPLEPFGLFSISPVGVPVALAGVAYLLLAGRWALPLRASALERRDEDRDYLVALRVAPDAAVVGQRVSAAGLRQLSGLFLAHIEREGELLPAVGPEDVIHEGDVLVLVGVKASVVELHRIRGLVPVEVGSGTWARHGHGLVEAVIPPSSPLVGQTIRHAAFRTTFGGVIVAVHRRGERLPGKLGDIRLRGGDAVLIEAPADFAQRHAAASAFQIVSGGAGPTVPRHERAWVAALVFLGFVASAALGWVSTVVAAMVAAAAMVLCRCVDVAAVRRSLDWPVLVVIGTGVGLAAAVDESGLAGVVADAVVTSVAGRGAVWVVAALYALTWGLTSVLSNTAAATLVFPIALRAAASSGMAPEPLLMSVAIAASCEFTTPIGYQTNLMVQGPGGYRLVDYLRFGGPLTLVCAGVAVTLIARIYY